MSEIEARHVFRSRRQRSGEQTEEFVAELKKLAARCNFGDSLEENLRDQFVCGLANYAFRWRLTYEQKNETLEEAVMEVQKLVKALSYDGNSNSGPFVRSLIYTGIDWERVDAIKAKKKVQKNPTLKILYQNVNGIKGKQKLSLWRSNLCFQECYIVVATETLLDSDIKDEDVAIREWEVLRKDREEINTEVTTGSSAADINKEINSETEGEEDIWAPYRVDAADAEIERKDLRSNRVATNRGVLLGSRVGDLHREESFETDSVENLWASFQWNGQTVFICVVYFSPKAKKESYSKFFAKTKNVIDNLKEPVVILGDMNLRSKSHSIVKEFNKFLKQCDLEDVNKVTNVFNAKLDVVLIKKGMVSSVYESEGIVPPDANHPPFNVVLELRHRDKTAFKRCGASPTLERRRRRISHGESSGASTQPKIT